MIGRRTLHARTRRRVTEALLPLLILLLASGQRSASLSATEPLGPDTTITAGLKTLHQGDYTRAIETFRRAAEQSPGRPEPLFLVAFSRWWQLILESTTKVTGDTTFDSAAAMTLEAARSRLLVQPRDAPVLAAAGGVQVLSAHVEALRGNYFHSGQEARRGKKSLQQALEIDPALDAALFPMGALNYYADRVPAIVKGLRPLFLFPSGDAPMGLRQIRSVATGSGPFRTDGRLLLAIVCSDRYQRSYPEALAHFAVALKENPGSPTIAAAMGDLQLRLGDYEGARATFQSAIAALPGGGVERAHHLGWLRAGLADARLGAWQLEEARQAIGLIGTDGETSQPLERAKARLGQELAAKLAGAPFMLTSTVRDNPVALRTAIDQTLGAHPGAPIPHFLRGRMLLEEGRADQAIASLTSAAAAGDGPPWLTGWIEILSGIAEARRGETRAARSHLRRASDLKRFRAADRARLEMKDKGEDAAACAAEAR